MAALTQGRNTPEIAGGALLVLPVAADTKIFEGALVAVDATGYAAPASKAENLRAAGRAEEYADNTGGAAGAISVLVKRGVFVWDNDTGDNKVAAKDVLADCYIVDDHTVTALATGSSVAGKVIGVTDEGVEVETR